MQYFAGKQNWKNVQKILYPNILGGIYTPTKKLQNISYPNHILFHPNPDHT